LKGEIKEKGKQFFEGAILTSLEHNKNPAAELRT
jgi:hypothetical protein